MKKRIKNKILNFILKHLFNSITEQDVLHVVGNNVFYKDTLLTKKQRDGIILEAKEIKNLAVYKILVDELKYSANKKIYQNSVTTDDLVFGKAALWVIDILETKINKLSQM